MKKIIILAIVVILIAGVYILFIKKDPAQVSFEDELVEWEVYDSVKAGWREEVGFLVNYPSDWHIQYAAYGNHVESIISDYELQYEKVFDNSYTGYYDSPLPIPEEHCQATFFVDGFAKTAEEAANGPTTIYENTYTDQVMYEKCERTLAEIKNSLEFDFTPVNF